MVYQSVNRRHRHHRISKDAVPVAKRLVGGNHQAFALIAMSNEFKQHRGFRLALFDIAQVVNHQQIVTVEFAQHPRQIQVELGLLKGLYQRGSRKELDPFA